jgi:hypothetical protein
MLKKKSSEEAREPSSVQSAKEEVSEPVVGAKTHHGHRSAPWARSKS